MSVARTYRMQAAEGKADELRAALIALAEAVRPLNGCEQVDLMEDSDRAGAFLFIERWQSVDAHKAGGAQLPKGVFGPVMGALAQPPESAWMACLVKA